MRAPAPRTDRAQVLYTALAYGTVLAGFACFLVLREVKETAAEPDGPCLVRVLPSLVPTDVIERVEILGRDTHFGQETQVTSESAGVLVSEVRLLATDRLEVILMLSTGIGGGSLTPGVKVPLAISSPLRDGGVERLECSFEVTADHRPVTLDLQSFLGQTTVEVVEPYVMLGYRPGGHGPWHLAVKNWATGEEVAQETNAEVEHLGLPVERGDNLLELSLTDATGRQVRHEVTVIHRPRSSAGQLFAFQGVQFTSYMGMPTQWSPTYLPYSDIYSSQAKTCSNCCARNGPAGAALGSSISAPPNGEGGECVDEPKARGCGPGGCGKQAPQLGKGKQSRGGAGVAKGREGGVVAESGQWRSPLYSDFDVPGRGLDFDVTRRYHSDKATDGYFGKGWDFNWGGGRSSDRDCRRSTHRVGRLGNDCWRDHQCPGGTGQLRGVDPRYPREGR